LIQARPSIIERNYKICLLLDQSWFLFFSHLQLVPISSTMSRKITAVCKANGTSDHFVNKNKLITSLLVALIAGAILDEISLTQVR
jgi:hypothetical protein